jgi:hypothetical protein
MALSTSQTTRSKEDEEIDSQLTTGFIMQTHSKLLQYRTRLRPHD